MITDPPRPTSARLTVVYRIEPGCLGPEGKRYIEAFCLSAQSDFQTLAADFIHWVIAPRYDKSLPEIQYLFGEKNLPFDKAQMFFAKHQIELDRFEELLNQRLAMLIDQHLGR